MPVALALALGGCGGGDVELVDASSPDAGGAPDGAVPASAPKPGQEIVSGAARIGGGGMQVDVQIGHAFGQQEMSGGSFVVEGAAVVKNKPGSTKTQPKGGK